MSTPFEERLNSHDQTCFDTSGDNLASLSLVEKYDRFIQNETSEIDSDGDFFPDDNVIREEYAQLTSDATNQPRAKNNRLSIGLPGKFRLSNSSSVETDTPGNGTLSTQDTSLTSDNKAESCQKKLGSTQLNELIEQLGVVRRQEPDGNSILCTPDELEAIRERYGAILDLIYEKSATFERKASSKDSENDEQVDVGDAEPQEQQEDMKLLAEKIVAVQEARDKFYEVEQQVREQVEQLELVERYKMESVG